MVDREEIYVHDVLIIGAGPCGLAVASRLRESTPSALFTDSEHQRYHWMKASSAAKRSSKPIRASRRSNTVPDRLLRGSSVTYNGGLDIAVLDAHGDKWMSSWNQKFDDLKISHLRSPMFFHPDPRDRDGLLEFAYKERRETELREIKGVVGKSLSKHQRKQKIKNGGARKQETMYLDERDRNDYFRPSQSLFKQYCEDIATRYNLSNLVQKSEVRSITYDAAPTSSSSGIFTLQTSTGTKKARIVVLAIGAALKPTLPPDCPFCGLDVRGSVTHAFMKQSLTKSSIIPEQVLAKIQSKKQISCVVIGGGLTSAQVTALLIASGVTKVYHLMRGSMKVKPFDIDLPWIGKYKNFHLASFWSADEDQERWEMMRDARGGGSITPEYKAILNKLVKERKVELVERTNVVGAEWDDDSLKWRLKTNPLVEDMPTIDHVVYATGIAADFNSVPAVKQLMEDVPVEMVGGMPCLTNDLMWSEEMPFFVTGRLAGLRLGPGAANLEGARQGAERVAWKVGDLLMEWKGSLDEADSGYGNEQDGEVDSRRLGLGRKNQFEVLGLESD